MANLSFNIDLSGLRETIKDFETFEGEVKQKVSDLALMAHAHILEEAQQKLNTRRQIYVDALNQVEQVAPGVWVIVLDKKAIWVEEGMPPHEMIDDLLKNNAKIAKDGSKYKAIPFRHEKGGATTTPIQNMLNLAVRAELKKKNIPYKTIERHESGEPKTGLLHKLDITTAPIRPAGTAGKPGWGRGQEGAVLQGWPPPLGKSTPLLAGIRIYQTQLFKKSGEPALDKQGRQKVSRQILTFRAVSSKQKGTGMWKYPGIEGTHFFEEAYSWCGREWEARVLPDLLQRFA